MPFDLFKRTESPSQACCVCGPGLGIPSQSPFAEVQLLTGQYEHENVALARCKKCGRDALCYSADVYDDFWLYWCLLDEQDREFLLQPDNDEETELPARARAVLARRATLIKGPVHGFEWAPSGITVAEGPPW